MCGLQLLRVYTGLRQDSKAVEVALELNRLYPNDPEVLYHTGRIFGNFAFLNMQQLAQVAPASVWRHQAEAEAYESQGSNDAAISEYRQVLSADPQRPGIHYRIGRTLLARSWQRNSPEDMAEAGREFEQELEIDPGNANAAYELAEIHRNAGEFGEAQKLFEVAIAKPSRLRGSATGVRLGSNVAAETGSGIAASAKGYRIGCRKRSCLVPAFASAGDAGSRGGAEENFRGVSAPPQPEINSAGSWKANLFAR